MNKILLILLSLSLLIKPTYLILVGGLISVFNIYNKYYDIRSLLIYFLFILWAVIGYLKFNIFYDDNILLLKDIGYLDFKFVILVFISIISINIYLINNYELNVFENKIIKYLWCTIVIMLLLVVFEEGPLKIFDLYGYMYKDNILISAYSYDSIASVLGVISTLTFLRINYTVKFNFQMLLVIILSIFLGRRSLTILPIILYVINYYLYNSNISILKSLKPIILLTSIIFLVNNYLIVDESSTNSLSRILVNLNSQDDEARFGLYEDFGNIVDFNYFGMNELPHEFNREKNSSFHNIIFDTYWYSGLIGTISYCLVFLIMILKSIMIKNTKILILLIIILIYQLFGASPFSGFMQMSILLPILISELWLKNNKIKKFKN